jgi:hypothetical protein
MKKCMPHNTSYITTNGSKHGDSPQPTLVKKIPSLFTGNKSRTIETDATAAAQLYPSLYEA